ncbi:TATA box-binding protein-associated factor RNA polymerase I subunit A isoform X2 [Engraulis encrasicolus]|uniref:TATA box-binding protein-associated factor RNA polymerase I subunit A isoform X2 n=1 Tax=Engraulis encrasicolus TaxID=184585 RepID=UPI002FCF3748
MDDIEAELNLTDHAEADADDESENGISVRASTRACVPPSLLAPALCPAESRETGFRHSVRLCVEAVRDAMLHQRWEEAAMYMSHYTQALEDNRLKKFYTSKQIMWRFGCEILHQHPNTNPETIIDFYEQMKNFGVGYFAKISLDQAMHLLLGGQAEEARRQLSVAENWRYGKQSISLQSQELLLIRAYRAFLDYITWRQKKTLAEEEADQQGEGRNPEMHSYFRQACVTLQEIIRQPGVWDSFVLAYVDMLEFYHDNETAESVLKDYAYDKSFPANPNAHVYLFDFLKRHNAPVKKQLKVLEILHTLVPSHKLVLDYCHLLLTQGEDDQAYRALLLIMELLEYITWKYNVHGWTCLKEVIIALSERCRSPPDLPQYKCQTFFCPSIFRNLNAKIAGKVECTNHTSEYY